MKHALEVAKAPAASRDAPHHLSAMTGPELPLVEIGLNAAIVSVHNDEPVALVVRGRLDASGGYDSLPFGPFSPLEHRTLEIGLRTWVREQTGLDFGYVEQLYTFGDRGRSVQAEDTDPHVVSIGYLALTHISSDRCAIKPRSAPELPRWAASADTSRLLWTKQRHSCNSPG